ncbi:MAG: LysE family translocator [Solirubrobacteraceae bacterium]
MSLTSSVTSFALVAGLITIVPGLDTSMVLRAALRNGPRHGFAAALGVSCGTLIWGAAAAVGVSALAEASHVGYTVIRVAGACYMVWLGARLMLDAARHRDGTGVDSPPGQTAPPHARQSWTRGFLTNLLNPKIGAFYLSVLPQFIPTHSSHLAVGLLLAGIHDAEALIWFSVIILAAKRASVILARHRTQRAIDLVTGSVLVGFGIRLGLSSR